MTIPIFTLFLAVMLVGCGNPDGMTVYSKKNTQSGKEETRVDRGVHHAALSMDPLPNPEIYARFWELDTDHQQPPLGVTGELLSAGLKKTLLESGQRGSYYFVVEPHGEFWSRVASASQQSADWKKSLAKKTNLNAVARTLVEQSAASQDWANAWQANGYTLTLHSLEKVQTCPSSDPEAGMTLCGAMIAYKALKR